MKRRVQKRQLRREAKRWARLAKRIHGSHLRQSFVEVGPMLLDPVKVTKDGRTWTVGIGERLVMWSRGFSSASKARRGSEPYIVPTDWRGGLRVWGCHGLFISDVRGRLGADMWRDER